VHHVPHGSARNDDGGNGRGAGSRSLSLLIRTRPSPSVPFRTPKVAAESAAGAGSDGAGVMLTHEWPQLPVEQVEARAM